MKNLISNVIQHSGFEIGMFIVNRNPIPGIRNANKFKESFVDNFILNKFR